MRRLPPLNAVRAFEAAARHLSFHKAAEELHVTPSAVSHQIRSLEDYLGAPLFRRLTRRIAMTREGQEYLPAIGAALDGIDAATRRITGGRRGTSLNLSVSPAFAAEWLIPRLSDFQARHPGIEVRLITSHDFIEFDRNELDLVILYGDGHWSGLSCDRLLSEELVPLCIPSMLEGPNALREPDDLREATLIHVLRRVDQWPNWLRAAGVRHPDPGRGPKFQSTPLALEAVMTGMGVMIANRLLVAPHLSDGRLVVPFHIDFPSDLAYYLIYPPEHAEDPKVMAFRDWLLESLEDEGLGP